LPLINLGFLFFVLSYLGPLACNPTCKSNQKLLYKIFANTLFIGQKLISVPECHSTNSLASELSDKSNLAEGTVVITPNQTAGRGQRGNSWEATAGLNLTFSILLKPTFLSVKDQFQLTLVTSLAVTDYLKSISLNGIKIKWPNDILIQQKKVGGILIENSLQGAAIQKSIVGIGLNINQQTFSIATATSLSRESQKAFDLNESLNTLLGCFEQRYLQLRAGKSPELKQEYLDYLFGLNERRAFTASGLPFEGVIQGVNDNGELIVQIGSQSKTFSLKEISLNLNATV
jgi:BirA family biotin operon repressor/biotin-[acetyl-CoA-carboxylase] ligase